MQDILNYQVQEGWVWIILIPILAALGIGATAIIIGNLASVEGKKIAVLGMKEAGKTLLYCHLQGVRYDEYIHAQTSKEDVKEFTLNYNGREIKFYATKDIGGGNGFWNDGIKLLKGADAVVFLFDAKKYLTDADYQLNTRAYLELIHRHGFQDKKSRVVLASHLDEFDKNDIKSATNEIHKSVSGKDYADMLDSNFALLDMRDREQVLKEVVKKIFP